MRITTPAIDSRPIFSCAFIHPSIPFIPFVMLSEKNRPGSETRHHWSQLPWRQSPRQKSDHKLPLLPFSCLWWVHSYCTWRPPGHWTRQYKLHNQSMLHRIVRACTTCIRRYTWIHRVLHSSQEHECNKLWWMIDTNISTHVCHHHDQCGACSGSLQYQSL